MTFFQSLFLGIIQGITEFLPISSSGHLLVVPRIFNWPDQGLSFDVFVHAGSLLALLIYFKTDIKQLFQNIRSPEPDKNSTKLLLALLVATIPVIIIGALLQEQIETTFRSVVWAGVWLIIIGLLILLVQPIVNRIRTRENVSLPAALFIGFFQSLAILPGVTRSGITIFAGTLTGLSHHQAARFSFLLGIPAILGATGKQAWDLLNNGNALNIHPLLLLTGFICSALTSFFAIRILLEFLKDHSLTPFAIYMMILGSTILLLY